MTNHSEERRNPYVILGVRFGASDSEARAGFARANRRLRQSTDSVYSMEDLTWALHQIEQIIEHPDLALDVYRIPAMESKENESEKRGLFNPDPEVLTRSTPPLAEGDLDALEADTIRRHVRTRLSHDEVVWPLLFQDEREPE